MRNSRRHFARQSIPGFAFAVGFVPAAHAATIDWINPSGGTFQVGTNWSGGVAPGTADFARFALVDVPINVSLSATVFNQRLIVAAGADVTFGTSGINYVANDAAGNGVTVGDVPGATPARLNLVAGGRIGAFDIALGEAAGSTGIGTIGAGASWSTSRTFRIGQAGAGTLYATPGSFLTAVAGETIIGDASTATGFLQSDSMFLSVGTLRIGRFGSGTWRITGETSIGSGDTVVGDQPGSHGVIDLVSNSEYSLGGSLYVGNSGAGSLMFHDGTIVVGGNTCVARLAGSTGRIDVSAGAFYAGNLLNVGGDANAPGGAGTVVINGGSTGIGQTLRAWDNGRVEWNAGSLSAGQVELKQGGQMTLASSEGAAPQKILRVTRLLVEGALGSRLDINDNVAIVNYPTGGPSPLADLSQQIAQGFAGGTWNGDGITSTFASGSAASDAIGIAEASQLGISEFLGMPVDATTILIRYTLAGDANLDGLVNVADFTRLAGNFGLSNKFWYEGDFNDDGVVNVNDFALLAGNFGGSINPLELNALPEPLTGAPLVALAAIGARRRRARPNRDSPLSGNFHRPIWCYIFLRVVCTSISCL